MKRLFLPEKSLEPLQAWQLSSRAHDFAGHYLNIYGGYKKRTVMCQLLYYLLVKIYRKYSKVWLRDLVLLEKAKGP